MGLLSPFCHHPSQVPDWGTGVVAESLKKLPPATGRNRSTVARKKEVSMRVKEVVRRGRELVIVLAMETSASISIFSDVTVKKEYIGLRNWGYFEDLKLTIEDAPETFSFLIRESEWGRKGRNYYYKVTVEGDKVNAELTKCEGNGYYAIVGLLR
jgi:hypothetical protein